MSQHFYSSIVLLSLLAGSLSAFAEAASGQDLAGPAIERIFGLSPKGAVFSKSSSKAPLVVGSLADAKNYFAETELKKLKGKVDFGKQVLMVFAWRGSGQDKLEHSVMESSPERLAFKYTGGRTRDLRPHVYCFVVRSNVLWNGKRVGASGDSAGLAEYVRVEVKGKLESNVMAIGAETTGIQVSANGITWELDFGENQELRQLAKKLDGKSVVLSGKLRSKSGVEIKRRWIVDVDKMTESGMTEPKKLKIRNVK